MATLDVLVERRHRVTGVLARRAYWWIPLAIFAASRIVDGLLVAYLAGDHPMHRSWGLDYEQAGSGHPYLDSITNWDGQWYHQIVDHGYPRELPREDGVVAQNAWAFYPAYPALVRALMTVSHLPFAVVAGVVSMLAGAAAMVLLFTLVERVGGRFNATTTVLALCLFPAAPVLQAAYTEGLALLFLLAALWCLRDQRYGAVVVCALALSLTRPIVLPLAVVVAVHGLVRWRVETLEEFPRRERIACAGAAVLTAASFAIWPAVAGVVTGDPGAYFASQRSWLKGVESGWPSWLAQVRSPDPATLLLLVVAFGLLLVVVGRRAARAWGAELRVWSVVYAVYLIGSTRPTTSAFRYAMLAVIPWWPFVGPPTGPRSRRQGSVILVAIVVVGVLLQYLWLSLYFIQDDGSLGYALAVPPR
jgi:hypothetical protein